MSQRVLLCLFISALTMLVSCTATAHKMKAAYTIVLYNERTQMLEVMHRFTLHDAEEASVELFRGNADIIADELTQAKFAHYVTEEFKLTDHNKKPFNLNLVGFQNDEGFFWVYQDLPLNALPPSLNVSQTVLREVWSEQINIVNIEYFGKTQTLTFSGNDQWYSAPLQ